MMLKVSLVFCACVGFLATTGLRADQDGPYEGHKLVRVQIGSRADLDRMGSISPDMWSDRPSIGPVEFRVPPEKMADLRRSGLVYEILDDDLQRRVDEEAARLGARTRDSGWFDDYQDLDAIYTLIDDLVALRPDIAGTVVVGDSLEGRPIRGLRITGPNPDGRCRPGLLLNSVQHAREWITPMVSMYHADRLVRGYGTDPYITDLVDTVEFIFIPVVNPDGYAYSWDGHRFWRKNRRDNGDGTFGVDLNRNWGFMWGLDGSSGDPDSQIYRGVAPFSEPETVVMRELVRSLPNLRSHNDYHSSGKMILQPWGFTEDLPPDHAVFDWLGATMRQRILDVHGERYRHGPISTTIYPVSGGSVDWFWGGESVYSLSYELRGPGFDPPPDQIIPCAEETFPATMVQAEWIASEFAFLADLNDDCEHDSRDIIAFLNIWVTGNLQADFNGDGSIDSQDIVAFLDVWASGR
jgi:hypothetical protein